MNITELSQEQFGDTVASYIEDLVFNLLQKKETVVLAFPGGKSIIPVFESLKSKNIDWKRVRITWVDERRVSLDSTESNYFLAYNFLFKSLLENKQIEESQIFPLLNIKDFSKFKKVDIAIFGVGEDGHIASIFPNSNLLLSKKRGLAEINNSPKLPLERITLTPVGINFIPEKILLFFGEQKRQAYENFKDSNISLKKCPAKLILNGKIFCSF